MSNESSLRIATRGGAAAAPADQKAEVRGLDFWYGQAQALKNVNMRIDACRVTALIGPSGCGKSTFLRCFNRMHDLTDGSRYGGEIRFFPDDVNILDRSIDPIEVH